MTFEEESYDMAPNVAQAYENNYEEKYEFFPVEGKNLSEGVKDKDYCREGKNRYIKIHKENETYVKGDDDLEKQCIFHRVAEEEEGLSYSVKSNEGFADTDSKTNYVFVKNIFNFF